MREASPATSSAAAVGRDRLTDCERVIASGMRTFVDVGTALAEIRDSRLYRATHETFEAYCRGRWGMGKRYANYQIESARVATALGTIVPTTPATESQARPLTRLEPPQQVEAWKAATDKAAAEDRPVTAKDVRAAVTAMRREEVNQTEATEQDKPQEEQQPARGPASQPVNSNAMQHVAEAINALRKIRKTDPVRKEAFRTVKKWVTDNE
jgi:hypothetical protein